MDLLHAVTRVLAGSTSATATDESAGAYWCHDCEERIRDVDVAGEEPPDCPSCGEAMTFERSTGTAACAC